MKLQLIIIIIIEIFIISCQTATKYKKRNNNITVRLVHIFKNHSVYEVSSVCVS